jgi:hypothetical protein
LTIAAPAHQEQNAFVERAFGTASRMARSMLVSARLPLTFFHLAIDYACKILRILPAKGLLDVDGNPTTTYAILHNKKPRIARVKVFGCPVVVKQEAPGSINTEFNQVQRGMRGIFVGFPKDQAGWLIFVPEKIKGSHLVISQDVVFDQYFLSGLNGSVSEFKGSELLRNVPMGGRTPKITETTGDVSNLIGPKSIFDLSPSSKREPSPLSDSESDDDSDNDSLHSSSSEKPLGTSILDGKRRSTRIRKRNIAMEAILDAEIANATHEFAFSMFALQAAADKDNIDITPYLPEPKNLRQILQNPPPIQDAWLKSTKKEVKFIIENETFRKGEEMQEGDEAIPAIFVYKAKITSKGYLDKLKARLVARGDLQINKDHDVWAPCVFARTFKTFVCFAVRARKIVKQLDFIGAFCQGLMKNKRLFITLPKEYKQYFPEFAEYFDGPLLLSKSIYGISTAHKVFADDLRDWLINEDNQQKDKCPDEFKMQFTCSQVDPSLYIWRNNKGEYCYLICYVDDCLYFGSSTEVEKRLENMIGSRFAFEVQGNAHWFLGTRIYRENDGSYLLDQETYGKHILNRYCGKESSHGLPPMKDAPAPSDYLFTKENRPQNEEEIKEIQNNFGDISMPSAVSSLLYLALNTRSDILWITNKLAKSASNPGYKDYKALMHCFGYLRKHTGYAIKFYADETQSPVYKICMKHNVKYTPIVGFTDSSWNECPDTGRSTCGYKIFIQGGLVEANSTMPVPVALSVAEAEYMGACNLGAMICYFKDLYYDFEFLATDKYEENGCHSMVPPILLIDNSATVAMSKNYKVSSRNRHIGRRWHFVRRGQIAKYFQTHWIPAEDQIADDMTKTQTAAISLKHMNRT